MFADSLPVAFVSPSLYLGGAERWILSLCKHFDPVRVRALSIVVECQDCVSPVIREALPPRIRITYGRRGAEQAAEMGCTLVTWGTQGLDQLTAGLSVPIVSVVHHGDSSDITDRRIASALRCNAHLVVVNEASRRLFPEPHRSRVTTIPNGADIERCVPRMGREATRSRLDIGLNDFVVAHVGRIMPDKGIERLVAATALLPATWKLLLCGPSEHWPDMPLADWQKQTNGRVVVAPAVDHIGDIMAATDVFSLLSPSEAHPLAVTEAWLAGVPTVVSDLPWIEALENAYGTLTRRVNRLDAAECASAIRDAHCAAMAIRTREIAFREFTSQRMAWRYENYLRKLNGRAD
jgi:glycosyltransferase involved in cell wall biosynthesis